MNQATSREWLARTAVTIGSLLPYFPVLSLSHIFVTDDVFTSDIFNGELPVRVLTGHLIATGQAPVWSSSLCSGFPMAAGGIFEPLSTGLFATLNIAPALCLLVIFLVLIAAHGAYTLARRLGAERSGAVLAGIAFAGSGYLVTQLKHLAISMTVAWLPWGLYLLDRALASRVVQPIDATQDTLPQLPSPRARLRAIGLFGVVLAEQVACGFPQSVYISGLIYGVWALVLLIGMRERVGRIPMVLVLSSSLALMVVLATLCGAPMLLPLAELGKVSDRRGAMSWEFASMAPYAWTDLLNFLSPYANGDIADSTYRGEGIFWENYGYVGVATFFLAGWSLVRGLRRPRVLLVFAIAVVSMALVLGLHTPIYHLAWKYMPGMGQFRFPTRFLVVVELAIALLGALGLGLLRKDCVRLLGTRAPSIPNVLTIALVLGTALDLFANQSHQNPFVPASEWLKPPAAVAQLGNGRAKARFYTPLHNDLHMQAFRMARGWANLDPYRVLRATVAPNTGVYWGVPTVDCYAGLAPSWFVDVWGDHSRYGLLVPPMMRLQDSGIQTSANYAAALAAYGVTHVLSAVPIFNTQMSEVPNTDGIHVYEVPGKRVRIISGAQKVDSNREAIRILSLPDFDPSNVLLLHRRKNEELLHTVNGRLDPSTHAQIVGEDSRHLRIDVVAPQGGYLLLADTYYPGWHAAVDGAETTLYRANLALRAVWLPPGARIVEFTYTATQFFRGLKLAALGASLLLLWLVVFSQSARTRAS